MPRFSPGADVEILPEMEAGKACELLGVTLEDVMRELNFRRERKRALMHKRMALAQRAGGRVRILKKGEIGGYRDMLIDPISYTYWGDRLGYECWDNDQFVAEYKRDNPESRVKVAGTPGMETVAMAMNKARKTGAGYRVKITGAVGSVRRRFAVAGSRRGGRWSS